MKFISSVLIAVAFGLVACKSEKTVVPPAAAAAGPVTPYPLDTCLVSGEKLGTMGKPYELVYEGRQIKFCCKNCEPDFKEDPAKFLAKLK